MQMEPNIDKVVEAQIENERTILDYLNEDCWHAVFKYLSVKEILRTERTSRHWQRVVLTYLSHTKIYVDEWSSDKKNHHNYLIIRFDADYSSFKLWTYKLGASVVSFKKYCRDHDDNDDDIEVLGKNCPNLEMIKLVMLMKQLPPNPDSNEEYFPCLKQICLDYCKNMTDDCVSQFLASNVLEELKILTNLQMTGLCLLNLKSEKLQSLILRSCWALEFPPLLTIANRLSSLTKLALARACEDIRDHVHILLDKLPKLEYLTVLIDSISGLRSSNVFFESVCRLKHLRHLSSNFYTWDQHLEKVTDCCKELEVLKLHCWDVTGRGAAAVRCTGPRLTQLDLAYSSVADEDVVAIVYACPNLAWLRLTACERLRDAVTRVAIARRELRARTRLHIVIEQCYSLGDYEEGEIEWLKLPACERLHDAVTRVATARRELRARTRLQIVIEQCYSLGDYVEEAIEDVLELVHDDHENDSDGIEDSY